MITHLDNNRCISISTALCSMSLMLNCFGTTLCTGIWSTSMFTSCIVRYSQLSFIICWQETTHFAIRPAILQQPTEVSTVGKLAQVFDTPELR